MERHPGSGWTAGGCRVRVVGPSSFITFGLALFFALSFSPPAAARESPQPADVLTGIVTYIYDGDTIKVRLDGGEEKKVRLIGVDAPEYDDPREDLRLSAFLARRFAAWKLNQKPVRLVRDKEKEDVYGRLLAYVWTDDRTMFNEVLVREGYASAYLKFPFDEAIKKRLREAEAEARQAEKGLWRVKPWPVVGPTEARGRMGQVVTVRFRCVRSFKRGRFRVLVPDEGEFEAVIPTDVFVALPGSIDFERQVLEVAGLIEEYKARPQIMIGLPVQVKIVDSARRDPVPPPVHQPRRSARV
jgi:micrococcal nuclease